MPALQRFSHVEKCSVQKFLGVLNLDLAARRSRAMTLLRSGVKSRFDTPD
jgi:hypothetical protein